MQQFLHVAPEYARYLKVQINADGMPDQEDLARLANERVMVRTLLK